MKPLPEPDLPNVYTQKGGFGGGSVRSYVRPTKLQLDICKVFGVHPWLLGYGPRPPLLRLSLWWFRFRHTRRWHG